MEQFVKEFEDEKILNLFRALPSGKKIRSRIIVEIVGSKKSAIDLAAIVELIHAASLLHDDVIDDAALRRSKPTIGYVYGDKTAIMLGDLLYAKAFEKLHYLPSSVSKKISLCVGKLSLGEIYDVELSKSFNNNKQRYLSMIYLKTASLIEATAAAAAILASKEHKAYEKFGRDVGMAFQMIDDVLDVISDSKTLGKPSMHDFEEGKSTLPYIYLYEVLDEQDREKLRSLHLKRLKQNEQEWIGKKMREHKIIQRCKDEAADLATGAQLAMRGLGERSLEQMAAVMIKRSF